MTKLTNTPARKISTMHQVLNWNSILAIHSFRPRGIRTRAHSTMIATMQNAGINCTNTINNVAMLA
ncbi:hypothetical protein D3C78_1707690 [compost metagenome]